MIKKNELDQLRALEAGISRLLVKADKVAQFFAKEKTKTNPYARAATQIIAAQSALRAAHMFAKTAAEDVAKDPNADQV